MRMKKEHIYDVEVIVRVLYVSMLETDTLSSSDARFHSITTDLYSGKRTKVVVDY